MRHKILELETKIWKALEKAHQVTIDLIQDAEQDCEDEDFSIGAYQYKVGIILEVIDKDYKFDIEILTELLKILGRRGLKFPQK
jgi:hypothetical protein